MLPSHLKYFNDFTYDCSAAAEGNRIAKHVFSTNGTTLERSTYYILDAQGNQISTYDHEVVNNNVQFNLKERNVYGSSRIGSKQDSLNVLSAMITQNYSQTLGNKYFEFSNHLGNVLTVFSDLKIPKDRDNNNVVDEYEIGVVSIVDYSPFGVQLDGRTESAQSYRYGFQNQEKDDEIKGNGNSVNYKYRMHDPRVGRFFAVDPLASKFPWNSVYAFSENRVLDAIELEGAESYQLNTFSFAPFKTFGGGFHGDGSKRKYGDDIDYISGTDKSSNFRIGGSADIDFSIKKVVLKGLGSYSYNTFTSKEEDACFSEASFIQYGGSGFNDKQGKITYSAFLHNSGNNCAVPGSCSIDVYANISMTFTYAGITSSESAGGFLYLQGIVTGDKFPSNEFFITDSHGKKVMLGVSGPDSDNALSAPFTELCNNVFFEENMSKWNFTIEVDKNYNFSKVWFGGKSYSIEAWNEKFTTLPTSNPTINTNADGKNNEFEIKE